MGKIRLCVALVGYACLITLTQLYNLPARDLHRRLRFYTSFLSAKTSYRLLREHGSDSVS